jgi:putative DNA primase/helicase
MSATPIADGLPTFGLLSQPYPAAVRAALHPAKPPDHFDLDPRRTAGLTDAGHAERFASEHGDRFRWDATRNLWLTWARCRWTEDRGGERHRAAVDCARNVYLLALTEQNLKRRELLSQWAIRAESRKAIENTLELAKYVAPIADSGEPWNVDRWVLNTPGTSGLIDLRTGYDRQAKPEDRLTFATEAPFDPAAKAPTWDRFVAEVFDHNEELIAFVQRAIGYTLTGDVREQVFFLCYGSGANGKSTFLDTLAWLFGDYAYATPFSTFELNQRTTIGNDLAALAGRRFVTASETNAHTRLNEARIKALTGGDRMNARHLYGHPFEFHPVCKIWLSVNHRPAIGDDSFGFWRRVRLIPFVRTFTGSAEDKGLKDTLRAEASGVLNWALAGCRAWLVSGLSAPAIVTDATDAYQRDSDPLADFLDDACDFTPGAFVRAADLYAGYQAWATRQGVGEHSRDRLSRKAFGALVGRRISRDRLSDGTRGYRGVEIRR